MKLGAAPAIPFGARLQIEPALDFRHPNTNLPDALTPRMTEVVNEAFSDAMTRFVLRNTHDEIVITAKRVYNPKMAEPNGIEFTVSMEDVPGHDAAANTRTYTCNPFVSHEQATEHSFSGLITARDAIWDRITTLDEIAKRELPF